MDKFHEEFDKEMGEIVELTREALLEGPGTCSREEIVGQIIMDNLFPHVLDTENTGSDDICGGKLTREQKSFLIGVADHLGPDWTQALYHAAVFMTRVA